MIKVKQTGDTSLANLVSIEKLDMGHVVYLDTKEKYTHNLWIGSDENKAFITVGGEFTCTEFELIGIDSDDYKVVALEHSYAIFLFDNLHQEGIEVEWVMVEREEGYGNI